MSCGRNNLAPHPLPSVMSWGRNNLAPHALLSVLCDSLSSSSAGLNLGGHLGRSRDVPHGCWQPAEYISTLTYCTCSYTELLNNPLGYTNLPVHTQNCEIVH